ncbi:MAG: GNAT family N-acetyltransferase [Anaerolineae bacterium]|nr:GNAT family N-acetyltransferase [Anaerolineae bacterium]MCA9889895.1 GNAT family N-acetyltransferase [Anaerolineae bacterium]MCA9894318.1 GNAT family N-acetyltransferase [Anaerolineae bacterium]MCB9458794.1 GNAT family N-acetyltransferase [Anaerolineaceae bacterium]
MTGHVRPVNLRTDLAPLADLIELVFAPTMDDNGRAAIRDMRSLSKIGIGSLFLGRLNELAHGISMGFVWEEEGHLVGNVSLYPAHWPSDVGNAWIIANVAVHPKYQRRGIAHRLLEHSLLVIRQRKGTEAILQVDYDNNRAISIYDRMGFIRERAFTTWGRPSLASIPPPLNQTDQLYITRRRPSEWQAEYKVAQVVRPNEQGGIGWLKPLHKSYFHKPWWQQIPQWFATGGIERLIVRADNQLVGTMWIDSGIASLRTRMMMMTHPDHQPQATEALLGNVVRRFTNSALILEHPYDDTVTTELLSHYRFRPNRTVWHMRLPLLG